jgi:hypothetical protein
MSRFVHVSLCVNEPDNGTFAGRVCAIHFGEEGHGVFLNLDAGDLTGPVCRLDREGRRVKISRRWFAFQSYHQWYGTWCWDAVAMPKVEAARLLNYLRGQNRGEYDVWQRDAGTHKLWQRWQRGEAFAEADLKAMT